MSPTAWLRLYFTVLVCTFIFSTLFIAYQDAGHDFSMDAVMTYTKRLVSEEYDRQYRNKIKHLKEFRRSYFSPMRKKLTVLVVPMFHPRAPTPLATYVKYIHKHSTHWPRCDIVNSVIINTKRSANIPEMRWSDNGTVRFSSHGIDDNLWDNFDTSGLASNGESGIVFVVNVKSFYSCEALEFAYRQYTKRGNASMVGFHGAVVLQSGLQDPKISYYSPYPYNVVSLTKGCLVSAHLLRRALVSEKYRKLRRAVRELKGVGINAFFSFVHSIEFLHSTPIMCCMGWMHSCYDMYDAEKNTTSATIVEQDNTKSNEQFVYHQLFKKFGNPFKDGIKKGAHRVHWAPQTYKYVVNPTGEVTSSKEKKFPLCHSKPVDGINMRSACSKRNFP